MKIVFSAKAKVGISQRMGAIYVFNDLLSNQRYALKYVELLSDRMLGIIQSTLECDNNKQTRERLHQVLSLWKEKGYFDSTKTQGWLDIIS